MQCLICHAHSNKLPTYKCGHSFHAGCLTRWEEASNPRSTGTRRCTTSIVCPYCNTHISLFKETRSSDKMLNFYNKLLWLLSLCNGSSEYSSKSYFIPDGYCEMCEGSDSIMYMKVNEDDGTTSWLCRRCQRRCWKYGECPTEEYIVPSSCEARNKVMVKCLNYIWDSRIQVRKNLRIRRSLLEKVKRYIEKTTPGSKELEYLSDKITQSEIDSIRRISIKIQQRM